MPDLEINIDQEKAPSGNPMLKYVAYEDGNSFNICEEYLPKEKSYIFDGEAKELFHFFIEYKDVDEDLDYIIGILEIVRESYYENLENKNEFIKDINGRVYVYSKY